MTDSVNTARHAVEPVQIHHTRTHTHAHKIKTISCATSHKCEPGGKKKKKKWLHNFLCDKHFVAVLGFFLRPLPSIWQRCWHEQMGTTCPGRETQLWFGDQLGGRCISRGSSSKWCFLQLGFTCAHREAQTFALASSLPASVIALTCLLCARETRANSRTHSKKRRRRKDNCM